jgi:H+/Cl- antiporter ClcA
MVESPERPVVEVAAVRRAPRYRAFVGVGALVLTAVTIVVVLALGDGVPGGALVLLALGGAVLGGLLGALVAVLLDRPSR